MKFGLSEKIITNLKSVFDSFPEVEKVILFGSRSTGNQEEGSDIDLALFGTISYELILKIKCKIDELNLPYKVDLHDYAKIKSVELVDEIDETGVVF